MFGKAWNALRAHGKFAIAAIGAIMALAIGGLSVALAQSGGSDERADRDQVVRAAPPFERELDPELEAQMEEFRECMSDAGSEPPEPARRPDISEGPPEGLPDALEECEELLPGGGFPGPPHMGPPPGVMDCDGLPKPPHLERSGESGSAEEQSGE
jgi:hypothetical protein